MTEVSSFCPETWVPKQAAFIFRLLNRRPGDVSIFCVPEATLKELQPGNPFRRVAAFDALRPLIYGAALEHIRTGSSAIQHVLTTQELKALQDGSHIPPQSSDSSCGTMSARRTASPLEGPSHFSFI